jgi:hypothetical protein
MNKRAANLTIEIIIVCVILLVFCIIMLAIFGGSAKNWVTGTKNCNTVGGSCLSTGDSKCIKEIPNGQCDGGQKCCFLGLAD